MVRLWSGYVLLLAIARPLRLVSLTLDMRKTSSPINKNHRRKSGKTTDKRARQLRERQITRGQTLNAVHNIIPRNISET